MTHVESVCRPNVYCHLFVRVHKLERHHRRIEIRCDNPMSTEPTILVQVPAHVVVEALQACSELYRQLVAEPDRRLKKDDPEVCGARGVADEAKAAAVLQAVRQRHSAVDKLVEQAFDDRMQGYLNLGCDDIISAAKQSLLEQQQHGWSALESHFHSQRGVVATVLEHRTINVGGLDRRWVREEEDGRRFLQPRRRYQFYQNFQRRRSDSRQRTTLRNGDVRLSEWAPVSAVFEENVGGEYED